MQAIAASAACALVAALASPTPVPPTCSHDSFAIDGKTVAVTVCVAADRFHGADAPVMVNAAETWSAGARSFVRHTKLEFAPGSDESRSIEDVPLAPLGLARSLHVTILCDRRGARIEHALLVPGAVPLE